MGKSTDFNDMAQAGNAEQIKALIDAAEAPKNEVMDVPPITDDEGKARKSQASDLVDFVLARSVLFHNRSKDVFATDNTTHETRKLETRAFKDWLGAGYYKETGKSARAQSIGEAISTLAGLGRHDGEQQEAHFRVAGEKGVYYIDLAEAGQSRVVKVMAGHWEITQHAPVKFIRTEVMQTLPEPITGGDIALLWQVANIPEADRLLVLAWMCDCFRPDTPFPVLELLGEQGSAKSTTQRALRKLIDPNQCDLRGAPKTIEDIFVSAGVNWLVSYENMSFLSPAMQDALCVLATGGGQAKRKLYSDAEETVIDVKRPIILNGISEAVTAHDLIDRTITVELPLISHKREESGKLEQIFTENQGALFGALLDLMAKALAKLPEIHIEPEERPRLIEFALLGMAISEVMGVDGRNFLNHFHERRNEAIARTLESSPVALTFIAWFDDCRRKTQTLPLQEIYNALDTRRPSNCDSWIKSAKGLGDTLRRIAPALRTVGIDCKSLGKVGGSVRWQISEKKKSSKPSPESPACPAAVHKMRIQHDTEETQNLPADEVML